MKFTTLVKWIFTVIIVKLLRLQMNPWSHERNYTNYRVSDETLLPWCYINFQPFKSIRVHCRISTGSACIYDYVTVIAHCINKQWHKYYYGLIWTSCCYVTKKSITFFNIWENIETGFDSNFSNIWSPSFASSFCHRITHTLLSISTNFCEK